MNSIALKQRLQRHLLTCSAVPGAALVLSGQQSAEGAVTYLVPGTPVTIPNTFAGIYFNLHTGAFSPDPLLVPGWDVNPYGATALTWYAGTATGSLIGASTATGGQVIPQPAQTDFSMITWDPSNYNLASNAAIQGGGTFFVALQFVDGAATTNNAWLEITTTGPGGFPARINRWAYAPVGEPGFVIGSTASSIPEPGSAALALLAAGAAGMRRRRRAA